MFRHCYSSGSFRHPSNRCASSKLSCSAFSRPNVEFSAFPNSSICCKQSHEFTKAGAQCSLGVCAYPIRTRLLAVHLASSADSTPRSDAGVARRCIFASQGSSCICTVPTVPSNDNEIGSLRVRHRPSTDRSTSHAEANIPDSPMRVKCGPGRVGILPVVGDSASQHTVSFLAHTKLHCHPVDSWSPGYNLRDAEHFISLAQTAPALDSVIWNVDCANS